MTPRSEIRFDIVDWFARPSLCKPVNELFLAAREQPSCWKLQGHRKIADDVVEPSVGHQTSFGGSDVACLDV
jgi:hypothetical protein